MSIEICLAKPQDADAVFTLLFALLKELYPHDPLYTAENLKQATQKMLNYQGYWLLVAYDGQTPIGVVALNECAAIYALGEFGEITELYVLPDYRSARVGAKLVEAAQSFARTKQWSMLEVGAPDQPKWDKTLNFYLQIGFRVVGPRLYQLLD